MAQDADPGYTTRAEPEEAQANARTIAQIPSEQLPWPEVRAAITARALAGFDCYAYTHASLDVLLLSDEEAAAAEEAQPVWVIWDRQSDPAVDARFIPRDWAIKHGFAVGDPGNGGTAA